MVGVVDASLDTGFDAGFNRRSMRPGGSRRLRGDGSLGELSELLLRRWAAAGHEVPVTTRIAGPHGNTPNVEDNEQDQATNEVVQAMSCQLETNKENSQLAHGNILQRRVNLRPVDVHLLLGVG